MWEQIHVEKGRDEAYVRKSLLVFLSFFLRIVINSFNLCTDLTVDRIQTFIPQLFSRVHVESLIHGNVTEKEALDMIRLIESKLKSAVPNITPLWQQQLKVHREIRLDDGKRRRMQKRSIHR